MSNLILRGRIRRSLLLQRSEKTLRLTNNMTVVQPTLL